MYPVARSSDLRAGRETAVVSRVLSPGLANSPFPGLAFHHAVSTTFEVLPPSRGFLTEYGSRSPVPRPDVFPGHCPTDDTIHLECSRERSQSALPPALWGCKRWSRPPRNVLASCK